MSMVLELYRGSEEELRAHLGELGAPVNEQAEAYSEAAQQPASPMSLNPLSLLFQAIKSKITGKAPAFMAVATVEPVDYPEYPADRTLDIDKAWHGLHFLFTGEEDEAPLPAGFLLSGQLLEEYGDVGYGPPYMQDASMVKEISEFLSGLTEEELRSRFAPEKMKEIYPSIWDRDPAEDDTLQYLLDYFSDLKEFICTASGSDQCIAIVLT